MEIYVINNNLIKQMEKCYGWKWSIASLWLEEFSKVKL